MTIIAAAKKRSEVSACSFGAAGRAVGAGEAVGVSASGRGDKAGLSRVAIINAPRVPAPHRCAPYPHRPDRSRRRDGAGATKMRYPSPVSRDRMGKERRVLAKVTSCALIGL